MVLELILNPSVRVYLFSQGVFIWPHNFVGHKKNLVGHKEDVVSAWKDGE